jgi:WD40 repeat protein
MNRFLTLMLLLCGIQNTAKSDPLEALNAIRTINLPFAAGIHAVPGKTNQLIYFRPSENDDESTELHTLNLGDGKSSPALAKMEKNVGVIRVTDGGDVYLCSQQNWKMYRVNISRNSEPRKEEIAKDCLLYPLNRIFPLPDGSYLVREGKRYLIGSLPIKSKLAPLEHFPPSKFSNEALSTNGRFLATQTDFRTVHVIDLSNLKNIARFDDVNVTTALPVPTNDGKYLITGDGWDTPSLTRGIGEVWQPGLANLVHRLVPDFRLTNRELTDSDGTRGVLESSNGLFYLNQYSLNGAFSFNQRAGTTSMSESGIDVFDKKTGTHKGHYPDLYVRHVFPDGRLLAETYSRDEFSIIDFGANGELKVLHQFSYAKSEPKGQTLFVNATNDWVWFQSRDEQYKTTTYGFQLR